MLIIYLIISAVTILIFLLFRLLKKLSLEVALQNKEYTLDRKTRNGKNCMMLETNIGIYNYNIYLKEGKLKIYHLSFNPDSASWFWNPKHHQPSFYQLDSPGIYEFKVTIDKSFDKLDKLKIVNSSSEGKTIFSYSFEEAKTRIDTSYNNNI